MTEVLDLGPSRLSRSLHTLTSHASYDSTARLWLALGSGRKAPVSGNGKTSQSGPDLKVVFFGPQILVAENSEQAPRYGFAPRTEEQPR